MWTSNRRGWVHLSPPSWHISTLVLERPLSHLLFCLFCFIQLIPFSSPTTPTILKYLMCTLCSQILANFELLSCVCVFYFRNVNYVLDLFLFLDRFTQDYTFRFIHVIMSIYIYFITSNCHILFMLVFCLLPILGHSFTLCLPLCPQGWLLQMQHQRPRPTGFWLCLVNGMHQQKTEGRKKEVKFIVCHPTCSHCPFSPCLTANWAIGPFL